MRKMSKNAWVFQMTVHGVEPDNDVIIQELINESGGLICWLLIYWHWIS